MSVLFEPPGGAVEILSACSELSELSKLTASSADPAGGFWELKEGVQGAGGEENDGRSAGRRGVLAAGPGPSGVLGAPSALLSSTVSKLSCRERSTDVESSTDVSSVSGPSAEGGAGL